MRGLVKGVEIEQLHHDVVHDCEEVAPMRKLDFVAILD